jgi:hypothetical protein
MIFAPPYPMKTKNKLTEIIRRILPILIFFVIRSAVAEPVSDNGEAVSLAVKKAVMCENVQDGLPMNQTIIFYVSTTAAFCWSELNPVPADGVVYHEWYRKVVLITRKKLAVHSPRWATYSRLPLRPADIGPWHLNITDENGNLLKTLRFSITE